MELYLLPLVIGAGLLCGFINTLAGSGSLITLPLLIFLGLPANVANGTNRVAILFQNLVAIRGFHKGKVLDIHRGKWLLLPAMLGALVGAQVAVEMNERVMRLSIAIVMVLMLFVLLLKPKRWLTGERQAGSRPPTFLEWGVFFSVGAYGGFIQAGVGIFLLAALVLASGFDLVKGNAVKVLIVLGFTPFALLVFIFHNQVDWSVGLILALGNMAGAWLGTRVAAKHGAGFVRWVLIAVVTVSAAKLFLDVFLAT